MHDAWRQPSECPAQVGAVLHPRQVAVEAAQRVAELPADSAEGVLATYEMDGSTRHAINRGTAEGLFPRLA